MNPKSGVHFWVRSLVVTPLFGPLDRSRFQHETDIGTGLDPAENPDKARLTVPDAGTRAGVLGLLGQFIGEIPERDDADTSPFHENPAGRTFREFTQPWQPPSATAFPRYSCGLEDMSTAVVLTGSWAAAWPARPDPIATRPGAACFENPDHHT